MSFLNLRHQFKTYKGGLEFLELFQSWAYKKKIQNIDCIWKNNLSLNPCFVVSQKKGVLISLS